MNFTETAIFHLPIQGLFALIGYHEFRKDRFFLTRVTGTVLSLLAACDFLYGVQCDFAHLKMAPTAFATFMAEMLKAYLFVNTIYVSRCVGAGDDYCFLKDCIKPLLAAAVIQLAQESQSINMLRPLLIGVIPTVAAAYRDTRVVNPHMVLWFQLALPMYSARYLMGTQRAWQVFLGWLFYHTFYLGIHVFHG